jgi:thiamine-phosphate pyrophosphorylase
MKLPRRFLCVITDENRCPVELARMALEGGARMLQLRRKNASGNELFSWAIRIQELCRQNDAIFVVNDRVDIAMAMQADGVHLGQEDLPAATARAMLGPEVLLGVSVSNVEEARRAHADGADYLGLGHIFPTVSKEKPDPPLGIAMIEPVRKAVDLPIVAIGGIDADNASEVIRAGASGLAVISAVASAENPIDATRELIRKIWL